MSNHSVSRTTRELTETDTTRIPSGRAARRGTNSRRGTEGRRLNCPRTARTLVILLWELDRFRLEVGNGLGGMKLSGRQVRRSRARGRPETAVQAKTDVIETILAEVACYKPTHKVSTKCLARRSTSSALTRKCQDLAEAQVCRKAEDTAQHFEVEGIAQPTALPNLPRHRRRSRKVIRAAAACRARAGCPRCFA